MHAIMQILQLYWTTPIIPVVFLGITVGIIGGALPGISPSITMALLVPFTYTMSAPMAIVLLATTYLGAEYGGSVPAILINTPGTNSSVVTTIDGYAMKLKGLAPEALGISLYSGVLGALVGFVLLTLLTKPLVKVALAFTPMSYFALGVLGLSIIATLGGKNLFKALATGIVGMMVSTIGADPISGVNRFTFGQPDLISGIEPVLIMVGLFAVSEILLQAGEPAWDRVSGRARLRFPNGAMRRRLVKPQVIGAAVGTFEGCMPGAGGTVASFIAYNEARRWSRYKEEFGHGSPEGVAAPETSNATVTYSALIPTLSFGIPGSNSTAVLLGGLLIQGLTPGPQLFAQSPHVIDGLYGGMFAAPFVLLVMGILILPACIWLVNRPRAYLMAFILALIFSGVYSINNSMFDLGIVMVAGVAGFVMRKLDLPFLPAVLGLVLGFMVESNYRRSLVVSGGDKWIFLQDHISAAFLVVAALFVFGSLGNQLRLEIKRRRGLRDGVTPA
ncbi:tripartite tricarboxylate transporter permease [Pinirhizobacter sp.]|jgi:putative tricarboxylic transport membrane protein|uniref:tripartite tricarboxylate transporter permease n=1 Tax=Pinirhizobacter sp. TaxID=2950432 RepID=UPI002F3E8979